MGTKVEIQDLKGQVDLRWGTGGWGRTEKRTIMKYN